MYRGDVLDNQEILYNYRAKIKIITVASEKRREDRIKTKIGNNVDEKKTGIRARRLQIQCGKGSSNSISRRNRKTWKEAGLSGQTYHNHHHITQQISLVKLSKLRGFYNFLYSPGGGG